MTSFLLFGRIRRLVILPSLAGCTTRVSECAKNATNNIYRRDYIYLLHPLSLFSPACVPLSLSPLVGCKIGTLPLEVGAWKITRRGSHPIHQTFGLTLESRSTVLFYI